MAIQVRCAQCGETMAVDESKAGRKVRCRACGAAVMVTAPDDEIGLDFSMAPPAEDPAPAPARSGGEAKPWESDKKAGAHRVLSTVDHSEKSIGKIYLEIFINPGEAFTAAATYILQSPVNIAVVIGAYVAMLAASAGANAGIGEEGMAGPSFGQLVIGELVGLVVMAIVTDVAARLLTGANRLMDLIFSLICFRTAVLFVTMLVGVISGGDFGIKYMGEHAVWLWQFILYLMLLCSVYETEITIAVGIYVAQYLAFLAVTQYVLYSIFLSMG